MDERLPPHKKAPYLSEYEVTLGWVIPGETPPWLPIAGGALCLIGIYLACHD
jgi:hypothetical protein